MEDEHKDYDTVIGKFNAFFKVCHNVIYKQACFNFRNQLPGETSEVYIMALHNLTVNYKYGNLEEEMNPDRLVIGIRDFAHSE